jgi:uncharacterized metal-binding protein YceD (DUF177 family)
MLDGIMEEFKIYIDRLKGGQTAQIEGSFDPSFLEIQEPELRFHTPVKVQGEAYLTDDHLVLHMTASTIAEMPCAICNEMIRTKLAIKDFYHTEGLSEIPSAVFDISAPLREALLIELPRTVECNEGHCPSREVLKPFMRPEKGPEKTDYFPFSNIDLNN